MDRPQRTIEHGFTLIELLIAMAISLIVLTSISSAFIIQRKAYNLEEQKTEMIQTARAAMDLISSEVKMAGYHHWDQTFTPLLQTTDSTTAPTTYVGMLYDDVNDPPKLGIKADLNSDGNTAGANEEIVYDYDSTDKQIDRDTGGGGQPFAENIEDFSFRYFGHNYDAATESVVDDEITSSLEQERIRVIEITIIARTADPDPNYTDPTHGDGYRRYTLTSYITPPNLRN